MQDLFNLDELYHDEERLIRDQVQQYVTKELIPLLPHAFENAEFPGQFIVKAAELGLLGMTLPKEYGGSDASPIAYGLTCQELERGDSGLRSFISVQSSLCMYPIFKYGSEEQKRRFLPAMAKAQVIGCFGLSEPDIGSNPAGMKTFAKKVDGGWCLNGSKMWITNAPIADIAIIWANTDNGIRGFIVEKDFQGFKANEIKLKMSLRISSTGELVFDNVFIPDANYLPGSGTGLAAPLGCLTQARYGIAWGAIGAATACFDITLDYTKQRQQFDKPVASFQLVQKDLTDMATAIYKAQLLNVRLGRLKERGDDTAVMVCMAKMNNCHDALTIARNCRNLLGANGISLEYHIIRHLLNLESVYTYEGTDNIHHLAVGRYLTGISAFN